MNRSILLLIISSLFAACEAEPPAVDAHLGQGQLELTSDVLADTDVARILYTATQVDCATGEPVEPPFSASAIEDLVDAFLPGGNGALENAPLDAGSQHLFADHFFWLPEGCYDVLVTPLNADGEPSEDCATASQSNVPVFDGQTTEIMLISQCENDPAGGLDVIAVINHSPQIVNLTYGPSKFVCDGEVEVCIEVFDPDVDPMTFILDFDQEGVRQTGSSQSVTAEGNTIYCATFVFAEPGDYNITATVYDMGWDENGDPISMEDLLAAQGDPNPSNDQIQFPVHVLSEDACINTCECPEGFELNADGTECERVTQEEAQFNGATLEVCRGNQATVYGGFGAQFPDGLVVGNPFFGSGFGVIDGRLNEIGVWACGPLGQLGGPSSNPTNEWIGFSRCLEVEESGEYVIGIAADNQIRFRVNGVEVFSKLGANVDNFRYWWMVPVTLSAGTNIIEMEGLNNGSIAAFGAEIYGPYAPGSTSSDAAMAALDYESNIIWTTGDQVATDFQTGTNSGYSCPDGLALDLCTDNLLCTGIERLACE